VILCVNLESGADFVKICVNCLTHFSAFFSKSVLYFFVIHYRVIFVILEIENRNIKPLVCVDHVSSRPPKNVPSWISAGSRVCNARIYTYRCKYKNSTVFSPRQRFLLLRVNGRQDHPVKHPSLQPYMSDARSFRSEPPPKARTSFFTASSHHLSNAKNLKLNE